MIKIIKEATETTDFNELPKNPLKSYKGFKIDIDSVPYGRGYKAVKDNFEIHYNNYVAPKDNYEALLQYIDEYVSKGYDGRTVIKVQ